MKHFVDTSVLRPLLFSSQPTQEYYKKVLTEQIYYCNYVKMEFVRGFIIPCMNFHSSLSLPKINSISDALHLLSQNFHSRTLKVIIVLFSELINSHHLDLNSLRDKERASLLIADYIRRTYSLVLSRYKDIGTDNKLCNKLSKELDFDPSNIEQSFLNFITFFEDKSNSLKCNLHLFLNKNQVSIDKIKSKKSLKITNTHRIGFKNIIDALKDDNSKYSCIECSKIGDLIIALICPKEMSLEHTDHSFDFIMTILEKPHTKHSSEYKLLNDENLDEEIE